MSKSAIKYLFFLVLINFPLFSQHKDTIIVVESCKSLNFPHNAERLLVCSKLKIDSVVIENEKLFDVLPQPLRTYDSLINSVSYNKFFLYFPIYKGNLYLKILIDTSGTVEILKTYADEFQSSSYEDSIINTFKREKFSPAKSYNYYVKSIINIYLSSYLIIEEYKKNETLIEKGIDLFESDDIPIMVNKYFILEMLGPEEKWRRLAKEDLAMGKCYLLSFGYHVRTINDYKIMELSKKYGFKFIDMGCVYHYGASGYNEEMMKYLTAKNGEGWYERFLSECRALNK